MVVLGRKRIFRKRERKRLRFSSIKKEWQDDRVYIPLVPEHERTKEAPKKKDSDRGVVIIHPDGSAKKMDGDTISSG